MKNEGKLFCFLANQSMSKIRISQQIISALQSHRFGNLFAKTSPAIHMSYVQVCSLVERLLLSKPFWRVVEKAMVHHVQVVFTCKVCKLLLMTTTTRHLALGLNEIYQLFLWFILPTPPLSPKYFFYFLIC